MKKDEKAVEGRGGEIYIIVGGGDNSCAAEASAMRDSSDDGGEGERKLHDCKAIEGLMDGLLVVDGEDGGEKRDVRG